MGKRESRQKPRQSDAIRGEKKPAKGDRDTDRDTLRQVREWAEAKCGGVEKHNAYTLGFAHAAEEVMCILNGNGWVLNALDFFDFNGTERKGEKR